VAVPGAAGAAPLPGSGGALAAAAPHIVDAPLRWSAERARLTLDYRRRHSDPAATDLTIAPRVIVLHHTGAGTARSAQHTFDPARLGGRPELQRGGAVNVSAHFLIDRDGQILRLQPETRYARHCIGLNHLAIGVELVGGGARWPLTDAQLAATADLVRDLVRRFPGITHLVGHHEASALADHPYYVELDPGYRNAKPDPGAAFMARARAALVDLRLHGAAPAERGPAGARAR
jgi:N-acetyl-anhydromuramyl-L-alanine amidase AmpD